MTKSFAKGDISFKICSQRQPFVLCYGDELESCTDITFMVCLKSAPKSSAFQFIAQV